MKCWRYLYQTFNCTRLASRLSLPTFTMFMSLLVMEKKKRNWFLLFGMGWLPLLSKHHCFNGFLPLNMSENKCLSQLAARLTFAKHVRAKCFDLCDLDLCPKVICYAKTFSPMLDIHMLKICSHLDNANESCELNSILDKNLQNKTPNIHLKYWRYLYQTFDCTRLAFRLSFPTFSMLMPLLVMEKKKSNWFSAFRHGVVTPFAKTSLF